MELCAAGSVADLASGLTARSHFIFWPALLMVGVLRGRKMNEDQIAYIIKDVLHTLIYLQVFTQLVYLPG